MAVAVQERFSDERITAMRAMVLEKTAGFGDIVGSILVWVGLVMLFVLWPIAIIMIIAGTLLFHRLSKAMERERTKKLLKAYDHAAQWWETALAVSDPQQTVNAPIPLAAGELALYSGDAARFAERNLGANVDLVSTTQGGGAGAVIGGIAFGGGASSGYTQGTITQVYGNAHVDSGTLVVTNQRVVFLGAQNTIEISRSAIMRVSTNGVHVVFEYAGRPPGEAFQTHVAALILSMRRRGDTSWFSQRLASPPPLPEVAF